MASFRENASAATHSTSRSSRRRQGAQVCGLICCGALLRTPRAFSTLSGATTTDPSDASWLQSQPRRCGLPRQGLSATAATSSSFSSPVRVSTSMSAGFALCLCMAGQRRRLLSRSTRQSQLAAGTTYEAATDLKPPVDKAPKEGLYQAGASFQDSVVGKAPLQDGTYLFDDTWDGNMPEIVQASGGIWERILSPEPLDDVVAETASQLRIYSSLGEFASALVKEGTQPLGNIFNANWENHEALDRKLSLLWEANIVRPSNAYSLQHFYDLMFATKTLRPSVPLDGPSSVPALDSYFAFGRMADVHPYDKLACDWCALNNGLADYMVDLLSTYFENAEDFDPDLFYLERMPNNSFSRWVIRLNHLNAGSASDLFAKELPFEEAAATRRVRQALHMACARRIGDPEECAKAEKRIYKHIRPVLEVSWFAEAQEQRWCPFRHAANVPQALRVRPYYTFDSRKQEELDSAVQFLRSDGRVSCRECAVKLDELLATGSYDAARARRPQLEEEADIPVSPKLRAYYEAMVGLHSMAG
eukprot:TRINITY_DN18500_c0_g1_i1.p1 TRINITY_DN18500_c0_g1~~TRINITY_DN18500_c0_g1_i1.p1  ORF type:complete len:532 (-),score=123.86 TRINITY_DN18500_c0_g1_i1:536-2131(-)